MAQIQVTDITELLKGGQNPDANIRNQAEQQLQQFQEQNYAGFLLSLCAALAGEDKPPEVRRLAGIILKNTMDAKDKHRKVGGTAPKGGKMRGDGGICAGRRCVPFARGLCLAWNGCTEDVALLRLFAWPSNGCEDLVY